MGTSPSEVEREITELRRETDWIMEELEFRVRRAFDVRAQVRSHPYVFFGMLSAVFAGLGFLGYNIYQRRQRQARAAEALHRLARGGGLEQTISRIRRLIERPQSEVTVAKKVRQEGMLKRVLWAMLSAGMVAMFGLIARRLSASLWENTLKERPPQRVP